MYGIETLKFSAEFACHINIYTDISNKYVYLSMYLAIYIYFHIHIYIYLSVYKYISFSQFTCMYGIETLKFSAEFACHINIFMYTIIYNYIPTYMYVHIHR